MAELDKKEVTRHAVGRALLDALRELGLDAHAFLVQPFSPKQKRILQRSLKIAARRHKDYGDVLMQLLEQDEPSDDDKPALQRPSLQPDV